MGAIVFSIGDEVITPHHGMLECVRHRGPDHAGVMNFNFDDFHLSLGCRHYRFTDLTDNGRQPISYEDGESWIAFDGEIYNHQEIRRLLISEGYSFKSDSDAEVIVAAYSRWGVKCLKHFHGMFAFCIYNQEKGRFFLARDRLGLKPLYFINRYRNFTAVSEIKQLSAFSWFRGEMSRPMLYDYISTGVTSHDSLTLWKDVFELPPGHYIEQYLHGWAPGCPLQAHCWYRFNFNLDETLPHEEAIQEYRARLEQSVTSQLQHHYPVGLRVSGDLNSAAIAGLAAAVKPHEKLKTFSLYGEGGYPDNMKMVSAVARFIQAESHAVDFKSRDFLMEIDRMIYANDLPVEFNRGLFNWLLYAHGDCNRRIILDGEGASQFLFGTIDYYWALLNRKMFNESAATFISDLRKFKWISNNPWLKILGKLRKMTFGRGSALAQSLLIRDALTDLSWPEPDFGYPEQKTDQLNWVAVMEIMHHRETLHFLDRCAFHGQCEIRHPFLDYRLIDLALRLPMSLRLENGLTKVVLRQACADVIPKTITEKSDLTEDEFVTESKWQKRIFHTLLLQNIDDILREPFIDKNEMAIAVHKFTTGRSALSPVIWRLIAVNRWKKIFNIA